jgi:VIT1/CCC1 family predicted Fe2+/Mn2+ transporter
MTVEARAAAAIALSTDPLWAAPDEDAMPAVEAAALPAGPAALIRDVILGGQDGLVNVLGLVLGMAAATSDTRVVVTAGLAALLAESIAMAGVAFTSSGAERQLVRANEAGIQEERARLRQALASRRRAALSGRGLSQDVQAAADVEAERDASVWIARMDEEQARIRPVREGRPLRAAVIVGISTAIGSAVPLLPFAFLPIAVAPIVALVTAGLVLAVAGFERADLTGGSRRRAAAEMLAIGIVSAFAGYLIGLALRVPTA